MKKDQDISQVFRQLRVPASSKLDERVYEEFAEAGVARNAPSSSELTFGQILALLLKNKSTRYTLGTTVGLALLVVLILNHSTSSAWAMDQAVEAIKKYKGIHATGYYKNRDGQTRSLECWARSDSTGNRIESGVAASGDGTIWTRGNKTYAYYQSLTNGYVEPGINLGTWFGPKLLAELARMKDYKAFEGDDPATGQKRVIVTCSLENFEGPQSFLLEFDARTKLLISMKSWLNLKREGTPQCDFEKITYFEDLPDSAFNYEPPAGTQFTDVPLEVSESNLSLLSDPKRGISADGMTREQACQKILGELWTAALKLDRDRIRQLCPVAASWSDEMLSWPDEPDERAAEVLKIGGIEQTGSSKLGSLALVPCRIRYQDGSVRENWIVVQFRETDQGTSCVVVAPRGYGLVKK